MDLAARLPRRRRLWTCSACSFENIATMKQRKPTTNLENPIYQTLKGLLDFERQSAEGILMIKEDLDRITTSNGDVRTEGQVDQAEFNRIVKVVYRLKATADLMRVSGLDSYIDQALTEIIRAHWGPRPVTLHQQK